MLSLTGTVDNRVNSLDIIGFFDVNFGIMEEIKKTDPLFVICEETRKVYNGADSLGVLSHPKVEDYFLKRSNTINTIAIEVPVWKFNTSGGFITGHIDILSVIGDTIIIADLKPLCKNEIFKSIPQILVYAFCLEEILWRYGIPRQNYSILCIGFCKDEAWKFDSRIMRDYILPLSSTLPNLKKDICENIKRVFL